jgi:serine phosphatase RsbU (regulator of sigma subunit)/CHASE2 domain-containing sensor protein
MREIFAAPGRPVAFAVLALLVLIRVLNPSSLEDFKLRGFDLEQQLKPRAYESVPVRVVAIDENSLRQFGQWPWPRNLVAQLVHRIAVGQPRVLGVDIIFAEPDRLSPDQYAKSREIPPPLARELEALPSNDAALADAFREVPTVLAVGPTNEIEEATQKSAPHHLTIVRQIGVDPRKFLFSYPGLVRSLPELTAAERGSGQLVDDPDADGIVRRTPLFVIAEQNLVPSLAVEMLRVASRAGTLGIAATEDGVQGVTLADRFLPTDWRGRAFPYFADVFPGYISAADLLNGSYDPAQFRGGTVLLGVTGLGLTDLKRTPLGLMAGTEVHAQIVECILTGKLLRRPSILNWIEVAIILFAGQLVIFALPYRRPRMAIAMGIGIVVVILGAAFASFASSRILLDAGYPALSTILVFGVMLATNLRASEYARRELSAAYERQREHEARLAGELSAARAIQMGLLPRHFPGPPERRDVDVYALIEPARTIGGDLYDFLLLDSKRLCFAIADVSGEGVPAALFMAMTKEVLRSATMWHGDKLDQALVEANAKISAAANDMLAQGANMMFVTVFAGVIDLATGVMVYANAGHDSPFLLHDGTEAVRLGQAGGPPLGTVDDFLYPVERLQLSTGDMLLLYTDGVTEAQDRIHSLYAMTRLEHALSSTQVISAKAVVDVVRDDVRRFVAGAEQADDITLMAIRWLGRDSG